MDALEYLERDLEKIEELFSELAGPGPGDAETESWKLEQLSGQLLTHLRATQTVFYRVLEERTDLPGEEIRGLDEEHRRLESQLEDLRGTSPGDPGWPRKLKGLHEEFGRYRKTLERELFPRAKDRLSERGSEALTEELQRQKRRAV